MSGLARQFICPHSHSAIENEIDKAEQAVEDEGTLFPDSTYEDGIQEALRWVLGRCPPPMSDN